MNIQKNIKQILAKRDSVSNSAVLFDADNSNYANVEQILSCMASVSNVSIRRAYGNWTKRDLEKWIPVLQKNAITPFQQFDVTKGKNATDIALTVSAMDIMHVHDAHMFGIVADDSDYCPLALRLREGNKIVIGFGSRNAPPAFRNACNEFVLIEEFPGKEAEICDAVPGNQLKCDTKLMNLLREAVNGVSGKESWAHLGQVDKAICDRAQFDPVSRGYVTLLELFQAIDIFEVTTNKGSAFVRDRRSKK